ncbi:MAG: hypothetical protein HC923_00610 [Myxococcales bacterium]|nr:hypothetical protein [Myxococcales bacterium]
MTATPIPRTLNITQYGDLAVTRIDELPPGRSPISTQVVAAPSAERAYAFVETELKRGRQAYVISALIEASELLDAKAATDAYEQMVERYPSFSVALLHGRMKPDEKADVMRRFARNDVQVLVSTTVVEVGVDVPNASCIVIEDADRFGLSQLHQLRGRIGRGGHPGFCFLISSREGVQRLRVLEATRDGFEIAERDLQLRGPGEVLGTRQAGLAELQLADLVHDALTIEAAREERSS